QSGDNANSGPLSRESTGSPSLEQLAAALAQPSNHPLSRALANRAEPADPARGTDSQRIQFTDWQELRGKGVQASLNGATLRLGSLYWLRKCGVVMGQTASSPPPRGEDTPLKPEI